MDYTPYKFTYFEKEKKPNNFKGKKREKGERGKAVILLIIFVVFVLSLALVGKYTERDLVGEVVDLISKKDTLVYYVVTLNGVEYKSDAEGLSRKVRLSGGSGYIIEQNGVYFVSLATYIEENEAKEVVEKNDNSTYITFTFDRREYLNNTADDGISKRVLEEVERGILTLIETTYKYDKKEITFIDASHRFEEVRISALNLKMEVLGKRVDNREELLSFLAPFIEGLAEVGEENLPGVGRGVVVEILNAECRIQNAEQRLRE